MAKSDKLKEVIDLKEKVEQQRRYHENAKGGLKVLYKRLEEEYDVDNLDDANHVLKTLEESIETLESNIQIDLDAFNETYGDKLDG